MAAIEVAMAWAASRLTLLANVLDSDAHGEALVAQRPAPRLLVAHVAGLYLLSAAKRRGSDWMRHLAGRASRAVALHTWLFFLGGGPATKLALPVHAESIRLSVHAESIRLKVERHIRDLLTRRSVARSSSPS
jgi:hypothetical protein